MTVWDFTFKSTIHSELFIVIYIRDILGVDMVVHARNPNIYSSVTKRTQIQG